MTDCDIVREIAKGSDPAASTMARFMGRPVTTLPENATREEITKKMRSHGIRRIPLVDGDGELVGIVSFGDLIFEIGEELFDLSHAIETGRVHEEPWPDPDR